MTNEYRTEAVECGDIMANSATEFSAPQLQQSGDISADSATVFTAPQLRESGYIWAESAKRIEL